MPPRRQPRVRTEGIVVNGVSLYHSDLDFIVSGFCDARKHPAEIIRIVNT